MAKKPYRGAAPKKPYRGRQVLIPGTNKTADSPWRYRLWLSRHKPKESDG